MQNIFAISHQNNAGRFQLLVDQLVRKIRQLFFDCEAIEMLNTNVVMHRIDHERITGKRIACIAKSLPLSAMA